MHENEIELCTATTEGREVPQRALYSCTDIYTIVAYVAYVVSFFEINFRFTFLCKLRPFHYSVLKNAHNREIGPK